MADPKDDARRHFAAGLEAANDDNFEIALQRFLAAQEAYPHPATLYNIAQSYADLNDSQNALTYYRLYRDAAPEKAANVDPIIEAIEARVSGGAVMATAPDSVATPGGAGGPVQVVVTGPTNEEMARLESLAAELEALMAAIKGRQQSDMERIASAQGGQGSTPSEPPDVPEIAPEDLPSRGGLLSDAYAKMVVSASRIAQDPLDSPSTLTVLTDEDIRLSGTTHLPDLLRRVVGVDTMNLTASNSDIAIRGFNRKISNKVLILIDGRSTYLDFVGYTFIEMLPISLEEIERIEIIRGPGSAVYGANAVTGVINIITKTPGERPENVVTADLGAPGFGRGTVMTNGRTKDTSYRLSAGYHQMGRWAKEFANPKGGSEPFSEDQDNAMKVLRANLRLDQTFGTKGFASISGGVVDGTAEYFNLGALSNFGLDGNHEYLRGDLAWGNLHFRTFWNSDHGSTGPYWEAAGQARTLDARYNGDAIDFEIEGPLEFETGAIDHVLNLGVGYRYKRSQFSYLGGGFDTVYQENHFNGFINEQLTLNKLGFVASLRMDKHPLLPLDKTLSPRTALIYRLFDKTSIRATGGTAFRAPSHIESYMDFNLNNPAADGVFIRDVGNRNLVPERITTVEVGIHDESTYYHTADAVLYMNQVSELIFLQDVDRDVYFYDPNANGYQIGTTGWENRDETYTGLGAEAELELYPTDGLDVFGNLNIMGVSEKLGQQTTPDRSSSLVKINAGTMYRTPYRTDFTYELHFYSKQTWRLREFDAVGSLQITPYEIPAHTLMSARIGSRPFKDEALEIAATAWNIAALFTDPDNRFIEHPQGQPVGGRLFGSLTYSF
jgi:iron complex outermembrane recepter protein